MDKEYQKFCDQVLESFPTLGKLCLPRRIIPPSNNFGNPRYYAANMAAIVQQSQLGYTKQNFVVGGIDLAVQRLIEFTVPTYFVHGDFLRAVAATELPDNFLLSEINWVVESMLFCLPLDVSKDIFGTEIPWITISHIPAGDHQPKFSDYRTNFKTPRVAFHFPVLKNVVPEDCGGMYPEDKTLQELINTAPWLDVTYKEVREAQNLQLDTEEDKKLNERCMTVATQLLLGIACAPNLVEQGFITRKAKVSLNPAKSLDELWSPNVIGRNFKLEHQIEGESIGRQVRAHIKKGHFKRQHYGKANFFMRRIWIKPYWVGIYES